MEQLIPDSRSPIPRIMGIINLSHDSFYQALSYSDALKKAEQMMLDGAAIIDVGAIATNPKINITKQTPSEQQELDLLIPFIERLSKKIDIPISVDTYRAGVMQAAVHAGATMINDQHALMEENALETAVKLAVPVCLMHHFNPPRIPALENEGSPQDRGDLSNHALLLHILHDLQEHINRSLSAGLKPEHIIIDPGFGGGHFGKSPEENFYLLNNLTSFVDLGFPVLIGVSRKSMFGGDVEDRLPASLKAAVTAAQQGAAIIRVHDVKETVNAIMIHG